MIQSLWIGKKLSVMEKLSIASFLKNGHAFHLYVYDEVEGVPHGTELKDANDIIPFEKVFKYKHHDSYAGFSDVFRYRLLFEKGGYWVDSDVVCLKPFQFASDYLFAMERSRRHLIDWIRDRYYITSWVIKVPAGAAIMKYCYREAVKRDPEALGWGEIGPKLIRVAVTKYCLQEYVVPWETFFPIDAWQWRQLMHHSLLANWKWQKAGKRSYGIHLYNDMWRRNKMDKNASFPRNSIYERLKRRYLDA
jgi:hypothetical protein